MTLTHERLISILRYEKETGHFYWHKRLSPKCRLDAPAGCTATTTGYPIIGIDGRSYRTSRLAWFYCHGKWPHGIIDHINGVLADNRISNLRIATISQNRANQRVRSDCKSGIKGVCFCSRTNRWRARLRKSDGVLLSLGYYDTKEEAALAYQREAEAHFGEFAFHNRPGQSR